MICMCVCMLLAVVACAAADSVYSQPARGISGAVAGTNTCFNMVSSCIGTVISGALVHVVEFHVPILGVWMTVPMLGLLALFWRLTRMEQDKSSASGAAEDDSYETQQVSSAQQPF